MKDQLQPDTPLLCPLDPDDQDMPTQPFTKEYYEQWRKIFHSGSGTYVHRLTSVMPKLTQIFLEAEANGKLANVEISLLEWVAEMKYELRGSNLTAVSKPQQPK